MSRDVRNLQYRRRECSSVNDLCDFILFGCGAYAVRAIDQATVHHHDDDMMREDRSDVICREARFLLRSVVLHKRWWAEVQEIHAVKQSCAIFTY